MSYQIEFELQGLPKTINAIGRKHWAIKAQEARHWQKMVALAVGIRRPEKPLQRARIAYTRHSSIEPDADNLIASFKHVQDGLVSVGVIASDKPSCIGQPSYKWEKAKPRKGFVRVKVEEV